MKVIILTLIFSCIAFADDSDPRLFDICVLLSGDETQIIKNKDKKEIDTEKLREILQIAKDKDAIVLMKKGRTRTVYINNEYIFYQIEVIGNHSAFYKIRAKDFIAYISGNDDWGFMPSHYSDIKAGKTLKLVPRVE